MKKDPINLPINLKTLTKFNLNKFIVIPKILELNIE
jgi:hypothetical protein